MKEEEKNFSQAQPLTETDKQEIVHALKNDIIRVQDQEYPKIFYEKVLKFLEQTHTNEDMYNTICTWKMFSCDLKIDYLLKNQSFYNFFKEKLIKEDQGSCAVITSFFVESPYKFLNLEYPDRLYPLFFLNLANRSIIEQIDIMNSLVNKNTDDSEKMRKIIEIFSLSDDELNKIHPGAFCNYGIPSIFEALKRSMLFNKSEYFYKFYKKLKSNLENSKILKETVQVLCEQIKHYSGVSLEFKMKCQIDFLKTLSYFKITTPISEEDLRKLDPVALLINCNLTDSKDPHTAVLLKILEEKGQKENIKNNILEALSYSIVDDLLTFFDGAYKIKSVDLKAKYETLLKLYNKTTLNNLADQSLTDQQKGLERLALTPEDIVLNTDSLKPLHPFATWKHFGNEGLLKRQLSNEEKCQKMFAEAHGQDVDFQRWLVEFCLTNRVPVSLWKDAVSSWNLDDSIKKEIEKRAKKAVKKPGNSDTQSVISYVPSQISYAPSSVASSINTEGFAQRLSLFQEAKQELIPQVTLIEKAAKFATRVEEFSRLFDIGDDYNLIQYPGVSSFLKHAQKHTVNSDSAHELHNKKKGQLLAEKDQGLIKNLHLTESLEDKKVFTAFILPKNLNLKEEESFIRYVESVLNGAKMLSVMQKVYEDDTDQIGITWKPAQPFEYFEFTKDPANKGDFLFQIKKGDYFVGALDQNGQNPRTIYPIEKPLEITPESELPAEMEQLSLSPKKPIEENVTNFKKAKRK